MIRYIRFKDREEEDDYMTAHVYVHYIGWKVERDSIKTVKLLTKDSLIEIMEEEGFLPRGMKTTGPKCDNNFVVNPEHSINFDIDSTLGGKINWKKVADFSALLPRDVKLKLWNGVWRTRSFDQTPEVKGISLVMRTFVMLQLTRVKPLCYFMFITYFRMLSVSLFCFYYVIFRNIRRSMSAYRMRSSHNYQAL